MYLKTKKLTTLEKTIIKESRELIEIVEEVQEKEALFVYELVRQQGFYNMLDDKARITTRLAKEKYDYIQKNYAELMEKYPEIKDRVKRNLEYIESANIAKIVVFKGCKNCIELVSRKLDITVNDLCKECRTEVEKYIVHKT